ncbi:MAG: hypothetical protein FD137_1581 [Spirochaetes bacterium]|nr:MAG: hypothetical protein FD137_1581 [Spirochaetota bacterium]
MIKRIVEMNKVIVVPLGILTFLVVVLAGFRVKPAAFVPRALAEGKMEQIAIPQGLPAPVERYYKTIFGDTAPKVETVVFYGRCRIKPFGLWMHARFVFIHEAGRNYRHYIEATWFGLPLLKVNEGIVDGASFFEAPIGKSHDDPNTNQGANLALWAEAGWFPSLWISDPRVEWKAVDENTALLYVPYGDDRETFVVRFDPKSGKVDFLESMRYRESGEGKKKILWITRNESAPKSGSSGLATGTATWMDQGSPWAYFTLEKAIYNADVSEFLRGRGL